MSSLRLSYRYAIPLAAAVAASVILIRRKRSGHSTATDFVHEIRFGNDQVNHELLERLRCNDPTLKVLSLCFPSPYSVERNLFRQQFILPAIQAIGTNTFLERLDMEKEELDGYFSSVHPKRFHNLQTLVVSGALVDDITAIAEALPFNMKLKTLTLCQWRTRISHDNDGGTGTLVFAGAFHRNQTLKTLCILCGSTIPGDVAALVVEGLPVDHNLVAISIRARGLLQETTRLDDDSAARIVRALCRTSLKYLSFHGNNLISKEGGARIVQILKENDHFFNKVELFGASERPKWQNEISLEVEKNTWAKRFLKISDAKTQEVLLPFIIRRAETADRERESKAPDMVFYILKEKCDLFGSSMDERKKFSRKRQNLKDFFRWSFW
jgi:hypothetical protein